MIKRCPACKRELHREEHWQCRNSSCPRYRCGDRQRFKPGMRVVVKAYPRAGVRRVDLIYTDIDGGRRLDQPVDGYVSWNVCDLRRARKGEH